MPPQRSQSPKSRVALAPLTGRYGLARPDERWTGPSVYFLPPDPERYIRTTNLGNMPFDRGNLLLNPNRASHGVPSSRHRTLSSEPGLSPGMGVSPRSFLSTPGATPPTSTRMTPVATRSPRNAPRNDASLPTTSAPTDVASAETSSMNSPHCPECHQRDSTIQSLVREQAEARAEIRQMRAALISLARFVDTAREEIDEIREDSRLHPTPAPNSGTHGTSTVTAAPAVVDPATVEAEFEDLMKQSVRGLALASSLFLRASREYISRATNPPPNAGTLLADTVDAYTDFWHTIHPLARTSRANRERLYALTRSPVHLGESEEATFAKSEEDTD